VVGLLQFDVLLADLGRLNDHEAEVTHALVDADGVVEDLLSCGSAQAVVLAVAVLLGQWSHAEEVSAHGSDQGLVV
jgi:hypothetical protein